METVDCNHMLLSRVDDDAIAASNSGLVLKAHFKCEDCGVTFYSIEQYGKKAAES